MTNLKDSKATTAHSSAGPLAKQGVTQEYELTYAVKTRESDVIANTLAAPLQKVRAFNSDNCFTDGWVNSLIFGDNLLALKNLYENPKVKGKVKLIYIDPPFATSQDFMKDKEKAYRDKVVGAEFLEFIRKRIIFMRELLDTDGSIYVHLDQKKGHYVKVLLDEIFQENNFQNEIIWSYRTGGSGKGKWSQKHDNIFFYSKSSTPLFNLQKEKSYTKSKNRKAGKVDYGGGTAEFFEDEIGVYNWVNARDVWDISYINSQADERLDYPTQKPEALLERIIMASSSEGDLVLDAFAGSGTTLAVAEKMKRRWIGIDCGKLSVYTIQKRILNLTERVGGKGAALQAKSFTLYNSGLYDWSQVRQMNFEDYRDFVLMLFQVREERHLVHGVEVDGYIGIHNAYVWNHTEETTAKLDANFVQSLHSALGGKGGSSFYIIAPASVFSFYEDEIRHDDTTYKTLRVPQSIITELLKRGVTLNQPTSKEDINQIVDSVGFDFIQVPEVETTCSFEKPKEDTLLNQDKDEFVIRIKTFRSRTLAHGPEELRNYETLSMVMIDFNYDGEVFDLDAVFYAEDLKPDFEVRLENTLLGKKIMAIYLDVYGNEKKEVFHPKDFDKQA